MNSIDKTAFSFLKELDKNNNREWFDANKPKFKLINAAVKAFGESLKSGLEATDSISQVKLFRIYRDVRFSKDKTPYKSHFGIAFTREKPALRGGYYIHLKPGDSFIATGFWDPNKEDLFRVRKELEMDAEEFRHILANKTLQKAWGRLEGEAVKTAPKGFSKEHPNIELIRHKQFIFRHSYTDKEVLQNTFYEDVLHRFKAIRPFFDYMSAVLTTDLNGVSLLED